MAHPTCYVMTVDTDWASDYCIDVTIGKCLAAGVTPTVFATNESAAVRRLQQEGAIEVGVHPDFRPHSTHGETVPEVVDHMLSLFPDAACYRSHCFVDSPEIQSTFLAKGFHYESNICHFLREEITGELTLGGLRRYPVFWEDDEHWQQPGEDVWSFARFEAAFLSPGIKILNFHPFNVTANIASEAEFQARKAMTQQFDQRDAGALPHTPGTGTFLDAVLAFLQDHRDQVMTLRELDCLLRDTPALQRGAL